MAIQVIETWDSRAVTEGKEASCELKYIVLGTSDHGEARAAVTSASPPIFDGLIRRSLNLRPISNDAWEASVRYGEAEPLPRPKTGDSSFSFDTTGGSQHITQSILTRHRYGDVAPDYGGAIGVTDDGVQGVDITVPSLQYSETHYKPVAFVTTGYVATLATLTGSVNNAPFRGFAAGEVLFLGASGSRRSQEDWEITYKFAASPNRNDITIGKITNIQKYGWDYLWVRYEKIVDPQTGIMISYPAAVYVEQVYPWGNFSLLGI